MANSNAKDKNCWIYYNGKWNNQIKNNSETNDFRADIYYSIAVELTLTE